MSKNHPRKPRFSSKPISQSMADRLRESLRKDHDLSREERHALIKLLNHYYPESDSWFRRAKINPSEILIVGILLGILIIMAIRFIILTF